MAMSKEAASLETSSDAAMESMCVPCLNVGDQRQAVKYCIDCAHLVCRNCVDCHRRFRQMNEHKLVEISTTEDLKLSQKLSSLLICPNHSDKSVELVCKNHDVFCCLTCATVGHRNCREVMEVTKEAEDMKQTASGDELKIHLTTAKDHMTSIVKRHEKCKAEITSSADELIPKKLEELKQKLIKAFAVMEEGILKERTKRKKSLAAQHDAEKAKWANHIESVDDAVSLLSSVQQNGSPVHVYVVANKLQKTIDDVDKAIAKLGNGFTTETLSIKEGVDLGKVLSCEPSRLAELSVTETTTTLQEYKYAKNKQKSCKFCAYTSPTPLVKATAQKIRCPNCVKFAYMINCPNCGQCVEKTTCPNCGRYVELTCPNCNTEQIKCSNCNLPY